MSWCRLPVFSTNLTGLVVVRCSSIVMCCRVQNSTTPNQQRPAFVLCTSIDMKTEAVAPPAAALVTLCEGEQLGQTMCMFSQARAHAHARAHTHLHLHGHAHTLTHPHVLTQPRLMLFSTKNARKSTSAPWGPSSRQEVHASC